VSLTSADNRQLEYIPLRDLELLELRDIREHVVEDIAERIRDSEYNPARPMRVVPDGDTYAVVDGNHRLTALRALDSVSEGKPIPCVVEPADADVYALSHQSNQDEDTYAEEDLFDHLDFIADLREDETQAEIAERLAWSESKVKNYSALLNKIVTPVLDLARSHQSGRVTSEVTSVTFTEGWFRTSGLYDLNRDGVTEYATASEDEPKHAQVRVMEWFVHEQNCDASKNAVERKVEDVAEVCDQLDTLEAELNPGVDDATRQELREEIIAGTYTDSTLESAIENANQEAKDRAVYGTGALDGLATVEDDAIDCVVTDPPYGEGFESVRPTENPAFDDGAEDTFDLLDRVFDELQRVCKANAHLYVFFSMTHYERVVDIAEQYFKVERTPLIWAKNRHAPNAPDAGGFEKNYAQKYEPVLHLRMPKGDQRALNGGVSPNVLEHDVPDGDRRRHDTQKPRSLLGELITNSTGKQETICDPFAGSGSTLLAAADAGRHYVGFELNDSYESGFRRELKQIKEDRR